MGGSGVSGGGRWGRGRHRGLVQQRSLPVPLGLCVWGPRRGRYLAVELPGTRIPRSIPPLLPGVPGCMWSSSGPGLRRSGEGNCSCLLGMGSSLPFPFARPSGVWCGWEAHPVCSAELEDKVGQWGSSGQGLWCGGDGDSQWHTILLCLPVPTTAGMRWASGWHIQWVGSHASPCAFVSTCWSSGRSTRTHMCYASCATRGVPADGQPRGQRAAAAAGHCQPPHAHRLCVRSQGGTQPDGVGWSWGSRSWSLAISGATLQAGPGPIAGQIHPSGFEFDMSALCFPHFQCKFEVPLYILDNFSAFMCQWYIIL